MLFTRISWTQSSRDAARKRPRSAPGAQQSPDDGGIDQPPSHRAGMIDQQQGVITSPEGFPASQDESQTAMVAVLDENGAVLHFSQQNRWKRRAFPNGFHRRGKLRRVSEPPLRNEYSIQVHNRRLLSAATAAEGLGGRSGSERRAWTGKRRDSTRPKHRRKPRVFNIPPHPPFQIESRKGLDGFGAMPAFRHDNASGRLTDAALHRRGGRRPRRFPRSGHSDRPRISWIRNHPFRFQGGG